MGQAIPGQQSGPPVQDQKHAKSVGSAGNQPCITERGLRTYFRGTTPERSTPSLELYLPVGISWRRCHEIRGGGTNLKAKLDLELSDSDLDERRADEKLEVQICWHPVHESGVLSLPAV